MPNRRRFIQGAVSGAALPALLSHPARAASPGSPTRPGLGAAPPVLAEARVHGGIRLVVVPDRAVRVVPRGPGRAFIDFGRATFGTVEVDIDADLPGELVVRFGEKLAGPMRVDRAPGGTIRYRRAVLKYGAGRGRYRVDVPPDARNTGRRAIKMPPELFEVVPFRFCELEGLPGPVKPRAVRRLTVHAEFHDNASWFESADPVLNDVWALCKHTIKATTFCGLYVDGDRERIPYEGDAYINQLSHYAVDADVAVARATHEYLLKHATWPTDWLLHSVFIAWYDFLYSGDATSLREHYELLKLKALTVLAGDDGLISTKTGLVTDDLKAALYLDDFFRRRNLEDLVDWPEAGFGGPEVKGERDGYVFSPFNTAVNALHFRALVLMERIARVVGNPEDVAFYRRRARQVAESLNARFFDTARGIYVDGSETDHASLHANAFPLMAGCVPKERRPGVIAFIKSRRMACSVYGAQHLLDGLFAAGEADYALELMTSRDRRSWANMIYNLRSTMTLEAWDPVYKPNLDYNHAWGAAPANLIVRRLLGVRPAEPGFRKAVIDPRPGSLRWAAARVPTLRGPIDIELERRKDGSLAVEVEVPDGMEWVGPDGADGA